jgi:O-methyltransferase involved in polyketide biosynthesis
VHELDQPEVLAFKESTLQANGAHRSARHVNVAVDPGPGLPKVT